MQSGNTWSQAVCAPAGYLCNAPRGTSHLLVKRENRWLAEEEPWTRHLCFHPSCTFDYELKTFDNVMSWLDKAFDIRGGSPWFLDDYGMPLEKTEYRTDLVGWPEALYVRLERIGFS